MQNMKEKLVKMESQVSGLESKMDAIANATRRMNERNASKREEVARLDRLGGLVNKLSTLFELPKKLRSAVDIEEIRNQVQLYNSAVPYLAKHSNVPSFAKIARDCKDAMEEIHIKLKQRLLDWNLGGVSAEEFDAMIQVLLDLGEPAEPLAPMFFRFYRDFLFEQAVPKEDCVKESFETCSFLLRTTMFEPLNQCMTVAEKLFPEADATSEDIEELKTSLAKDVMRSVSEKFRARFDAEPSQFLSSKQEESEDEGEEDSVDRIIRALSLAIKEFVNWDRALPTQTLQRALNLGDRGQELAERVVRKQVNCIMGELKQRTEQHLAQMLTTMGDGNAQVDFKQVLEQAAQNIINDAMEAKNHFTRLLKKANVVVSQVVSDMANSFDDLFKFQMRDWCEYLAQTLKGSTLIPNEETTGANLLAQALLAKSLSSRTKELGVYDQKLAIRVLSQAGDDALKQFCTLHGIQAAKFLKFSFSDPVMDHRPNKVGDGVVYLLNHVSGMSRLLKACGIPSRRAVGTAATGGGQAGGGPYGRVGASTGGNVAGKGGSSSTSGLGSHIMKIFSEKLIVFDKVEFDGASIGAATIRVALKCWFEHIREEVLTRYVFQQIQLDAHFVRNFVPLLTGDNAASVNKLVSEVVASARERCTDPSTMDPVQVDTLCTERKDDVKLRG
jgi:flagellar hook-basal body complex protein FliE